MDNDELQKTLMNMAYSVVNFRDLMILFLENQRTQITQMINQLKNPTDAVPDGWHFRINVPVRLWCNGAMEENAYCWHQNFKNYSLVVPVRYADQPGMYWVSGLEGGTEMHLPETIFKPVDQATLPVWFVR